MCKDVTFYYRMTYPDLTEKIPAVFCLLFFISYTLNIVEKTGAVTFY